MVKFNLGYNSGSNYRNLCFTQENQSFKRGLRVVDIVKILSVSDKKIPFIYSPSVSKRFEDIDFLIGCGDLPYYYLEYILTALRVPLFFVRGNHDHEFEFSAIGKRSHPHGGTDLHKTTVNYNGTILAGIEGSIRYKPGKFQYSQNEMWFNVYQLVPKMIANRISTGRYLDIFVTHAPMNGIHDCEDLPHHGIKAFNWFVKVFQPIFHFHGHIHLYRPDDPSETLVGATRVINTYGYKETNFER